MIKIDNAASVQVLHHEQIAVIGPILDLNLALRRLLHSIHEHAPKVLTLRGQNSFMPIYRLLLHEKNYVRESRIINNGSHIPNERIYCLVVNFVFFKFANVEDANVI